MISAEKYETRMAGLYRELHSLGWEDFCDKYDAVAREILETFVARGWARTSWVQSGTYTTSTGKVCKDYAFHVRTFAKYAK